VDGGSDPDRRVSGKGSELQSGIQLTLEVARLDVPEWLRTHLARL
jgi:hypothetical protein